MIFWMLSVSVYSLGWCWCCPKRSAQFRETHSEPHKIRHIWVLGAQLAMPEGPLRMLLSRKCCTVVIQCVQWDPSCRKAQAFLYHSFRISSCIPVSEAVKAPPPQKLPPSNSSLAQWDFMDWDYIFLDGDIQTPLLLLIVDLLQP